jgi:hypothetical protein
MKQTFFKLLVGVAIIFGPLVVSGQPAGGGPALGEEPDVPISGIEFILGGGMIYGARKIYLIKKNR